MSVHLTRHQIETLAFLGSKYAGPRPPADEPTLYREPFTLEVSLAPNAGDGAILARGWAGVNPVTFRIEPEGEFTGPKVTSHA